MISMKFGGTSMGSAKSIQNAAKIIKTQLEKAKVTVVVSAVSGMTDRLINLANSAISERNDTAEQFLEIRSIHQEIIDGLFEEKTSIESEIKALIDALEDFINGIKVIKELSPHSYDYITSYGERLSATILAHYLSSINISSKAIMADTFLVTNKLAGNADPLIAETKRNGYPLLTDLMKSGITPIVTGFMGRSTEGKITTLGRGGSDYSAAIVGAVIGASEIQIWTDVSGFYTTDPRICPTATPHAIVSFREASELARFGAKVLHPRTMLPAMEDNIQIKIKNTFYPEDPGTTVTFDENAVPKTVKAIALKKDVQLITICSTEMLMTYGFMAKIFNIFEEHNLGVDIVATSEVTVSISIEDKAKPELIHDLKKLGEVTVEDNLHIVSIVGTGLEGDLTPNAKILTVLSENNIDAKVITQGASQNNFSLMLKAKDSTTAVQLIHLALFEN
jgi:aspartate kinase